MKRDKTDETTTEPEAERTEGEEETTTEDEREPDTRKRRGHAEVRARFGEELLEIRAKSGEDGKVVMAGYVAPFNEWTEIDSVFEGRFLERIAPSAFRKTLQERQPKVLFQHGHDPSIGDKPIGVPTTLEERKAGEYFEVDLFDETSYVRDLIPALEAGQYGVSFRFNAVKEEFVGDPEPSDYNPHGLPERTVLEATLPEFGPVTFPAYDGATVGLRSRDVLTEEDFILAERRLIVPGREDPEASTTPEPTPERHSGGAATPSRDYLGTGEKRPSWAL